MYIVTGGAGFIGSAVVWMLNRRGIDAITIVDRLGTGEKWKNLVGLRFADYLPKDEFLRRIESSAPLPAARGVIHLGACSATTERDADYLMANNVYYSQRVAQWSLEREARLIYASSAATYGDGTWGYRDDLGTIPRLRPLNAYGYSKHCFDLWALSNGVLNQGVGLKFFNVFGPNEYHKGDMVSVPFKAFHELRATGRMRLFRSDAPRFVDGGQQRDFVYVKDVVEVIGWLLEGKQAGLVNLGSGTARSWNDLVRSVCSALEIPPQIEYIDLPEHLRGKYQNYTQADLSTLASWGCPVEFRTLEESVRDYVTGHLATVQPYLSHD